MVKQAVSWEDSRAVSPSPSNSASFNSDLSSPSVPTQIFVLSNMPKWTHLAPKPVGQQVKNDRGKLDLLALALEREEFASMS
jgi:hypothetical protein